jgi:PTH1 family peptidyl-tRNA hydrolase
LLVVCDDVNLPLGKLRFRAKGTHGGHNGLRDLQSHLGTTEYNRLRIGVDAPGQEDMVGHVLGKFKPGERAVVEEAVAIAAQGVDLWIRDGVQKCMNQYNSKDQGDRGASAP